MNLKMSAMLVLIVLGGTTGSASDIKHIFLVTDESRKQLHYVNEVDPAKDWTIPLKEPRDVAVLDGGRCLVNFPQGYREVEISTGTILKEISCKAWGIRTATRDDRGHTFAASSTMIWEFDAADQLIRKIPVEMGNYLRLLRLAQNGNFLFTGGATIMKEADRTGKIVRTLELTKLVPYANKSFFMQQEEGGKTLISGGYNACLIVVDKNDKLVRKIGGRGSRKDIWMNFFGGAEKLSNGNYVVANWTGHQPDDSQKAPQVLEFDEAGEVVWKWHDPKRAGSINNIAIIQ